ncbi:MAG: Trk system potassium transporter TrkA [Lagierella massiliensis]|nr:Trk system potassium transporter TrkA [Lagierella massiliensis]
MKVLIVGGGRTGLHLAEILQNNGHEISIIEKDRKRLKKVLKYETFNITLGDGSNTEVLENSNIDETDVFISTTSNSELNMILCLMATKLGAKMTICLSENNSYLDHVEFMGNILNIDLIINPKLETARYLLRSIYSPEVKKIDILEHGKMRLVSMEVEDKDEMIGKKVKSLANLIPKSMLMVEILRGDEVLIPKGDVKILKGDIIHLLSSNDDFNRFFSRRNGISPDETFFVVGGSLLSYYLVERLERLGHQVKVLEKDKVLVQTLNRDFQNCEAVYVEDFDIKYLEDEDVKNYDNLIVLTSRDEINLVLASLGKNLGVKRVFSNCYNKALLGFKCSSNIDMFFSEQEIVGRMVDKFIKTNDEFQDSKIGTLSSISKSKTKIEELELKSGSNFINKMISDLNLPKNCLIAFISRKNKIIIPGGDEVLKQGDVIILISTNE